MKKALTLIAILCMATMLFAGCDSLPFPLPSVPAEPSAPACEHDWEDATCTTPKTCSLCQVTEGEALGHTGGTATCTDEAVCTRCEKPYGEKAEHTWTDVEKKDATCTEDGYTAYKACTCGAIEGKTVIPAAHTWTDVEQKDATCTEDGYTAHKACTCGATEGKTVIPAGHTAKADDGDVTTAVTCERCDHIFVEAKEAIDLTIGTFENGAVVTDKKNYAVGEKVTLTITPADGYAQKLYINGEPLMLDWKTNAYSFTAEEGKSYAITGSFEPGLKFDTGKDAPVATWDIANQAHGILNTYYTSKDSGWYWIDGEYASISAIVKNYDSADANGFFTLLCFKINNKNYNFRVIKQSDVYYCQRAGFNVTGSDDWTKFALDADAVAAIRGEGAEFKLERTSANMLTLSVNGKVYDTYTLTGDAVNAPVTKACIGHDGNENKYVTIPFALTVPSDKPPVENDVKIEIPAFTNGTVATNKESYNVGDTAIIAVVPDEGYACKSVVVKKNGEAIDVTVGEDGTFSLVIEEGTYTVEAEFITSIFSATSGSWDLSNENDGSITILNKTKDGTTVVTNGKNYSEATITVKDYAPSKNEDGSLKRGNFSVQVAFVFDNGKVYEVRIHNTDADGNYKIQTVGSDNSIIGWKWRADLTTAQKEDLLNGDGVEFTVKLEGTAAVMYVNGTKMATVDLGADYEGKTAQVKICMNGNKIGSDIEIPFALK